MILPWFWVGSIWLYWDGAIELDVIGAWLILLSRCHWAAEVMRPEWHHENVVMSASAFNTQVHPQHQNVWFYSNFLFPDFCSGFEPEINTSIMRWINTIGGGEASSKRRYKFRILNSEHLTLESGIRTAWSSGPELRGLRTLEFTCIWPLIVDYIRNSHCSVVTIQDHSIFT